MRLRSTLTLALAAVVISCASAQQRTLEGVITDEAGAPIPGARVAAVASGLPAYTDALGHYRLEVPAATERVQATAEGYAGIEAYVGSVGRVDLVLSEGLGLDEEVGLGRGRPGQTVATALHPVEVIYRDDDRDVQPYATLAQVLTYASSSLGALPQNTGTPTDFVDPLALTTARPSQVALLVNGHRRHRSALTSTGAVVGAGAASFDLATIPLAAVERVEVLRGPAATHYGADAVAGVVNVVLRRDAGFEASGEAGGFVSGAIPEGAGVPDGRFAQATLGYGGEVGQRGGFARVTAAAARREPTLRMRAFEGPLYAGYNNPDAAEGPEANITDAELARRGLSRRDFRGGAGQAAEDRLNVVAHVEIPVAWAWTLYGFGDLTVRDLETTARYAAPNEARTNTALYPDGFAPEVGGLLDDQSAIVGARGRWRGWELDFSNGFGRSAASLDVANTANASLGAASAREFDAGGVAYWQNDTRAEIRRYFPRTLAGLYVAGAAGLRYERYATYAGVGDSYGLGEVAFDPLARAVPGGAQGLRGFSLEDAGKDTRLGAYGYAEAEVAASTRVSVGASVRYESYDDLGGGAMGDLRVRVALTEAISARAGVSSGFRAPTFQEARYRATYPVASGLRAGVFASDSPAARAVGLESLSLERHFGSSAGITARLDELNVELAVDGFLVDVEDAVTLTGAFGEDPARLDVDRLLEDIGIASAQFFANGLDTRTLGATATLTHAGALPYGARLRTDLRATYARTTVEGVSVPAPLTDRETVFLPLTNRTLLEAAVPQTRAGATFYVDYRDFTVMARGNYFGQVSARAHEDAAEQVYGGQFVVDASFSWRPREALALTVGLGNALDQYPDPNLGVYRDAGRAPFPRSAQQFGTGGRYVFARLGYRL